MELPVGSHFSLTLPTPLMSQTQEELQFVRKLLENEQCIILSPHLDDAVLSMGNLIIHLTRLKKKVMVVNVFTEGSTIDSPFTKRLLRQADASSAAYYFSQRRREDELAIRSLGEITIQNLRLIDVVWRGKNNEAFYKTIHDPVNPHDQIAVELETKFRSIFGGKTSLIIFSPLARGRHIDHLLVREAATKLVNNIVYYTDFPYVNQFSNEDEFITKHHLSSIEWHGKYEKKKEAILKYKSQVVSLFQPKNLKMVYEKYYFTSL